MECYHPASSSCRVSQYCSKAPSRNNAGDAIQSEASSPGRNIPQNIYNIATCPYPPLPSSSSPNQSSRGTDVLTRYVHLYRVFFDTSAEELRVSPTRRMALYHRGDPSICQANHIMYSSTCISRSVPKLVRDPGDDDTRNGWFIGTLATFSTPYKAVQPFDNTSPEEASPSPKVPLRGGHITTKWKCPLWERNGMY